MKKKHLRGTPRKWPRVRCHKERAIGRDLGLRGCCTPPFGAGKWVKHVPTVRNWVKFPQIRRRRSVYAAAYTYHCPCCILAEGDNLFLNCRSTCPACGTPVWVPWLGVCFHESVGARFFHQAAWALVRVSCRSCGSSPKPDVRLTAANCWKTISTQ